MSPFLISVIIVVYFGALLAISYFTGRNSDTEDFFTGKKQSPWYLVAFGMIGTSLSGVTFISVPGAVGAVNKSSGLLNQFAYFQLVLGYLLGYLFIGKVLMPMYYKLNLVSIYSYFETRFGFWSYKTGAAFFIISRTIGSSFRLYLAAAVLQLGVFEQWGFPFYLTVLITILLIWLYTFKGGIKTIIWTDSFQTFFLIGALITSILLISQELNLSFSSLITTVKNSPYSQVFFWDVKTDQYFFKQFISGTFIAIVMTGMDQDLMQKNLTCKNIGEAQKNMFWFCTILVAVNLMFLSLGALLYMYADARQIALPSRPDELYPLLALNYFGSATGIFFLLGIIASSYASADSALASLTTSFCIDFLEFKNIADEKKKVRLKNWVHIGFSLLLLVVILIFKAVNDESVITAVFKVAGYTYGPLLGLFFFGLFTRWKVNDKYVPYACVIAPILCYVLSTNSAVWFDGYRFGFEILLLNGAFTFAGLWCLRVTQPLPERR